jgi:hypothetical protein
MVASGTAGAVASPQGPSAGAGGSVPFLIASNIYVEKFDSRATLMGAGTTPVTVNVIPNGFLSGVRVEFRSVNGAGGTGVTADNPWNLFNNIELDNIDGANIVYPMQGYSQYIGQFFFRPWSGDPAKRFDFAQSVNPSGSLLIQPEIRGTAGVLANTDARSQYKVAYTVATSATIATGLTTPPTVTVNLYLETWAQPDKADLHGNAQESVPPGLNIQTLRRHQVGALNGAGAANTIQLANTGNELRGVLMLTRDSAGARIDALSDPIRWRLDTRAMGVFSPNELTNLMNDTYDMLQNGTSTRPAGVYMWQRFRDPGDFQGQAWLTTTNATYLIFESTTAAGVASPGTWEVITDEVIPVGPVPAELDSI